MARPDPKNPACPSPKRSIEQQLGPQLWLRRAALAVFVLLLIIISALALSPAPPKQLSMGWDKLNHATAFAALCFVGMQAWPDRRARLLTALLAHGGLIEVLQTLVPGRSGEWADLLADSAGLLAGWLLCTLVQRLWVRLSRAQPATHSQELG